MPIRGRRLLTGRPTERFGVQNSGRKSGAEDRCVDNYLLDAETITMSEPKDRYREADMDGHDGPPSDPVRARGGNRARGGLAVAQSQEKGAE